MKIILTNTVKNLGRTGDVVKVADGYARNYLIPKNLAILADEKNVKQIRHRKAILDRKRTKQLEELKGRAQEISKIEIVITRKAGENKKLFGSVTTQDLQAELLKHGVDVERRAIHLEEPIKAIGQWRFTVKLAPEVDVALSCQVVADTTEAEAPSATPDASEATETTEEKATE